MKPVMSIQALRACAALSVVLAHCLDYNWQMNGLHGQGEWARLSSGVDLFFVISGFVMVYSSENLFGVEGASRGFIRNRLARIVPIYWAATSIWLLLGQPFDWPRLVTSVRPTRSTGLAGR